MRRRYAMHVQCFWSRSALVLCVDVTHSCVASCATWASGAISTCSLQSAHAAVRAPEVHVSTRFWQGALFGRWHDVLRVSDTEIGCTVSLL